MNSKILASSTITGQKVTNMKDENIGDIQDLMIDPKESEVMYAVLSFGGFLGIGSKYFAVPMEALQFSDDGKTVKMDVDKEKLENAPSFDKDNWPRTADSEFLNTVYGHYGYKNKRRTRSMA